MSISFALSERIAAPVERLYAHLSEPSSFLGLQPLLVELTETGRGEDESGRPTRTFRTVELFRFLGFLPYRNTITVRMTLMEPNRRIRSEVDSPGGVRLVNAFVFEPDGETSVVRDEVAIDCPRLMRGFVRAEAQKAHRSLLQNLKKRMEEER